MIFKFRWLLLLCLLEAKLSFVYASSNPDWYNDYDVKWYCVDIHCNDTCAFIYGNSGMLIQLERNLHDTIIFELANNCKIDSVLINNKKSVFISKKDWVKVFYPDCVKGKLLNIQVYYCAKSSATVFFSSFSNKTDSEWKIPVTWSLSEPFGAPNWFACKQSLSDKADSVEVRISVPQNRKAGSNGVLTDIKHLASGETQYIWKSKYPTAFYLISFSVADYKDYSFYAPLGNGDSVLVQNYIYNRPGFFEKNKKDIDATSDFLQLYSKLYGTYPYKNEKYGHCTAPMGGGMEHQTMTTLSGFGFDLVSHELSHQWFGDLVTCDSWNDIWVNEGFASYSEYLAIEFLKSKKEADNWMGQAHDFAFYAKLGSLYIPDSEVNDENRIFNYYLTYKKGASVIHMLRDEIHNDSVFFDILKTFLSRYAFKSAGAKDFINIVNEKTGTNYNWFFEQWYYGNGYPENNFFWKQNNDSLFIYSMSKSTDNHTSGFLFNYCYNLIINGKDTIVKVNQASNDTVYSLKLSGIVTDVKVNSDNLTLMKVLSVNKINELPTGDHFFEAKFSDDKKVMNVHFRNNLNKKLRIKLSKIGGNVFYDNEIKRKNDITIDTNNLEKGFYCLQIYYLNKIFVRIIDNS